MRWADGLAVGLWLLLAGLVWWDAPWPWLCLFGLLTGSVTWHAWQTWRDTRTLHIQLERLHQDNRQRWLEEEERDA